MCHFCTMKALYHLELDDLLETKRNLDVHVLDPHQVERILQRKEVNLQPVIRSIKH